MSHGDLKPFSRKNPQRVVIVISNPAVSTTTGWPVGFWWSELTHPCFRFTELGYQVEIFSPDGGACVADATSDPEDASQWQAEDVISRGYKHDPAFVRLIENTKSVDEISLDAFDAIVVARGQGGCSRWRRRPACTPGLPISSKKARLWPLCATASPCCATRLCPAANRW
jgi:hypothetical protein